METMTSTSTNNQVQPEVQESVTQVPFSLEDIACLLEFCERVPMSRIEARWFKAVRDAITPYLPQE